MYIILLFLFNMFIIIILSNVKAPQVKNKFDSFINELTKFNLDEPMLHNNIDYDLSEVLSFFDEVNKNEDK